MIVSPLYEKWKELVRKNPSHTALTDVSSGECWNFQDLEDKLESLPKTSGVVMPRSSGKDFVLATLQVWRDGSILCPLESSAPDVHFAPDDIETFSQDVCHIKLTSGSTGEPRKILFRAEQLICDASRIVETMGLRSDSPNLGVISLAHSYGFSNLVLPLLLHGVPLIWLGDPLPGTMREAFSKRSGNETGYTLAAVPAMWRAWLSAGILEKDKIHLAISAGAPLTLKLEKEVWENCGIKIHNFYGSSECGGIAYDDSEKPRTRAGEIGRAMVDTDLSVDEKSGNLAVKSKAVAIAYWPQGEGEESDRLNDGVFQTTDQAVIESDGKLILGDRTDDIIHVAGRKISPGTVEAAITAVEGVRHCVVFGIPSKNPERIQEVVACINAVPTLTREEIEREIRNALRPFEVPRRWWITEDLLPDQRGKLSRSFWRERYLKNYK